MLACLAAEELDGIVHRERAGAAAGTPDLLDAPERHNSHLPRKRITPDVPKARGERWRV